MGSVELVYFTTIGRGVETPCFPATRNDWERLRKESWLQDMCAKIEKGNDELKRQLPVWTPSCVEYKDNRRSAVNAIKPLNRLMMDFDEKGHTNDIMAKLTNKDGQIVDVSDMKILLVEESARRGTHVLVELPEGMDVKANFFLAVVPAILSDRKAFGSLVIGGLVLCQQFFGIGFRRAFAG